MCQNYASRPKWIIKANCLQFTHIHYIRSFCINLNINYFRKLHCFTSSFTCVMVCHPLEWSRQSNLRSLSTSGIWNRYLAQKSIFYQNLKRMLFLCQPIEKKILFGYMKGLKRIIVGSSWYWSVFSWLRFIKKVLH